MRRGRLSRHDFRIFKRKSHTKAVVLTTAHGRTQRNLRLSVFFFFFLGERLSFVFTHEFRPSQCRSLNTALQNTRDRFSIR